MNMAPVHPIGKLCERTNSHEIASRVTSRSGPTVIPIYRPQPSEDNPISARNYHSVIGLSQESPTINEDHSHCVTKKTKITQQFSDKKFGSFFILLNVESRKWKKFLFVIRVCSGFPWISVNIKNLFDYLIIRGFFSWPVTINYHKFSTDSCRFFQLKFYENRYFIIIIIYYINKTIFF